MTAMIIAPAAMAIDPKMLSPQRPLPSFSDEPLAGLVGIPEVFPICCGLADLDEPTAVGSGFTVIS
jgi:hypothetical protein